MTEEAIKTDSVVPTVTEVVSPLSAPSPAPVDPSNYLTLKLESTESVREILTAEEIEAFAQLSVKEVQAGRPELDGEEEVGATHFYAHNSGKEIATYTLYNPVFREKFNESEWTVFVGLEEEIQMLLAEFEAFNQRLQPIVNETPKLGRNDPCSCGSNKKYKKCCLR